METAKYVGRKVICIFLTVCAFIVLRVMLYLFVEFIINAHEYNHDLPAPRCTHSGDRGVPKVIHQVMFNSTIPKTYLDARSNCQKVNNDFVSILWNKSMVDTLVHTHYPFIEELFYGYDIWVKRADVARYLIIHKHGGIYIDMDTNCTGRFVLFAGFCFMYGCFLYSD